eukprot:3261968-Prorocentrum_lima.AAC.1
MQLSEVRKFFACNIKARNPERTTLCNTRQTSLDKVNTEFPALVLDKSIKKVTEADLDMILGFLTSFVDLRSAASGEKMDQA